jgi:predicted dehydrogenase
MAGKQAALVGTGFIGPVHVEALRRLGVPIAGVLASAPEKGRQAAALLGLVRAYSSYAELLADPDVCSVHITSPNRFHFEQGRLALEAGKHVICEKPLAMNVHESAELVALAQRHPVVAAVCYNIRFYPLCLEARERIAAGELGEIYHINGSYLQDWLLYETDYNWRVEAAEGGALRAIADIGTHWLDLVQSITGLAVNEVCADLTTVWPERRRPQGGALTFSAKLGTPKLGTPKLGTPKLGTPPVTESVPVTTEDHGSVLLRFDRGARGCLMVSQVAAGRKNSLRFEIAGSKGALAWDSERPNELWVGHRDRPNECLVRDPALLAPTVRPYANYPGGHNEGFPDTFKQLFRAVYAAIDAAGSAPYPTFADGHRELLICDAILRSQRERRWAPVEPIPV